MYDKFTIGLNQAWKSLPFCPTINLTIHPDECIPKEYNGSIWVTKRKGWLKNSTPNEWKKSMFFFQNNSNIKDYSLIVGGKKDNLYVGRGIHTAACHLTGLLGSQTCVLIGCDLGAIDNQHHATAQSVRFHGLPPSEVYKEYYINLKTIRPLLKSKFDLDIIQMTPYLGIGNEKEEMNSLLEENSLQLLETPKDDSSYKRDKVDFS